MRWTGCGKMKEDGKTIIYSGHSNDHTLGVRICLSSSVAKALVVWKPVNESIITARFQTRHAKFTIIQVYAPIMEADDDRKDNFKTKFYRQLEMKSLDIILNSKLETSTCKLTNLVKEWNLP